MKKRLLAVLLTMAMLFSVLPASALAAEGDTAAEPCTVTEGCTLEAGHEGECVLPDEPETQEGDSNSYYEFEDVYGIDEDTVVISPIQVRINALPGADTLAEMDGDEQTEVYAEVCDIYDAIDELTDEEAEALDVSALEEAAAFFTQQIMPLDGETMSGNCGTTDDEGSVTWKLEQNNQDSSNPTYTLTISGSGAMKDYAKNSSAATENKPIYSFAPWWTSGVLSTEQIDVDGTAYDGTYLTGITKIVVESGVTRIGSSAFSYMRDVTEITIANSVASIGDRAFMYNYSLETILIPDSVQMSNLATNNQDADGELLLGHCYNLKNVTLGDGFTVIPCRAFENTEIKPSEITMDESKITGIGQQAFFQTAGVFSVDELDLTSFTALKTIATNAFSNWSIQSLKLPSTLEKIGSFNTVSNLTTVNWTDLTSLTHIDDAAFKTTALTSADLSNTKVGTIGWQAFNSCSALATVVLPSTITNIGDGAFSGMADGSTITVPEDKYTLLSGKYDPEKTTIITLGSSTPTDGKTIGLVHNGNTTYFSSFSSAANNAVSGDTIFATQSYTFANGEVALVKTGVSLTGGNLDGYGATYENDEITAYCDTLQTALASCSDGDAVKLNADVSVSTNMNVSKDITIDLNQKTVTSSAFAAPFLVKSNVTCTIANGTIQNTASNYGICVDTENGSTTTLSSLTLTQSNKNGSSLSSVRVRSCTVVLSGVTMSNQQLYTVSGCTPTVFFAGSNNSIGTNVIDSLGTWSLYFDTSNPSILSSNKSNATRYFLNCSYNDLSSINPINRENKTLTWYGTSDLSGDAVSTPAVNNDYYAKWDDCDHEEKSYTANNNVLTQTCATCGHVLGTATIVAPTELAYDGSAKEATVTTSEGWSGAAPTPAYYSGDDKLNGAPTDAGTYTAEIAVGDGNNAVMASVEFEITKFTPTISISASPEALTGSGTVTLTVSGLPDGASATPTCDGVTVSPNSDGTYSVSLPNETKEYTFTVNYAGDDNHEAATATCTVSVTSKSGSSEDTKVEVSGLTAVPEGLSEKYKSVDELTTALKTEITQINSAVPASNIAVYDVKLMVTTDDGKTWEVATKDNFPKNGQLTITLPYPSGTNSKYTFTVVHMFTTSDFNKTPGNTEKPTVTNTANGIQFTVTGLSPISVGWTAPKSTGGGGGSSTPTYTVTVDSAKNGTVKADRTSASKGSTVTLTVTPKDGYELDDLTVTDKNGDTVKLTRKSDTQYTFTMPASKVTVEASFTEIEEQPSIAFTDVPASAYYYDAVEWAVENGVTSGTSATTFSPVAACTRAQAMTFLWRAAGSPAPKSSVNPFTDVSSSAYYYDAVLWAVERGITAGTSVTTFSPDATCTRGQIVTFLYRADGAATAGNNPFTDVADNAYYADAVRWAVAESVTAGTSATTFSPDASCTRGQIVTFLYRAYA